MTDQLPADCSDSAIGHLAIDHPLNVRNIFSKHLR